jgi:hypothetical protein
VRPASDICRSAERILAPNAAALLAGRHSDRRSRGAKNAFVFVEPFVHQKDQVTKTGSGQELEKKKEGVFLQEHFDYDFEDLIQQANTQVESVLSRVHICEQDSANKRQASASPSVGSAGGPVAAAAISELAEELLMALRDCAALRRCVCFGSLAVRPCEHTA